MNRVQTKERQIPEKLTHSTLPSGARYELWHTPQMNPPYRLLYFEAGVLVNFHDKNRYGAPMVTETMAREHFEFMVESKVEAL